MPDFLCCSVKRLLKSVVASAMAIGGTMPPAMTAAMMLYSPEASMPVPTIGNPLLYLVAIFAGAVLSALCLGVVKKNVSE